MKTSKHLSFWLVFAIVYADIGTSVFYVPGLLYHSIGNLATLAQLITTGVFISICRKYVEICERCPDGGGVVSIAHEAFKGWKWAALLGGCMITIDYFLTSAISGLSGILYLQTVLPFPKALAVIVTISCLAALLFLNIVGLKESATVTSYMAMAKLVVNFAIIIIASLRITATGRWSDLVHHIFHPEGVSLSTRTLLIGYADTWLAYSGLESGAQIAGAMKPPVRRTASTGFWMVIFSISTLSPALTAFSTYLLPEQTKINEPDTFISHLGLLVGGQTLQYLAVVSATLLLIMACNTAIVGNYHVNIRLVVDGFLPPVVGKRHRRFGTPHVSIAISAIVPMIILLAVAGDVTKLGDMYAFGLLGALSLSSISIDLLRWREHRRGVQFYAGVFTTLALLVAWGVNLINKPAALIFGGGLTVIFFAIAQAYQRGWLGPVLARVPTVMATTAEARGAATAQASRILSVDEAVELAPLERASVLVALRGPNPRLLEETAARVRGDGQHNAYVVFVDELPGLFYPVDPKPTPEAVGVLAEAERVLAAHEVTAIPIWRLGHDAANSIADAAERLGTDGVMVGTSKRGTLWHLVRGNVLKGLTRRLPREVALIIVN
jgi:amino acid transporter/nucleotide-binding universal stress UspA family protein